MKKNPKMSNFPRKIKKSTKRGHHDRRCPIFHPKSSKQQKIRKKCLSQIQVKSRAGPIYQSADIYWPITRLSDTSYQPSSIDKLLAINKYVLFTIWLVNARFFHAYACVVAHTFKHENKASERACTHTQIPARQCMCVAMPKAR